MEAKDLKQDKRNYRKHSKENKRKIKKSIDECGLGRSVLVDADGVLIAGNGVASVVDKDTKIKVVETDGTELVVVKRTDLHEGDEKRKKLALADNATSDNVEWDFDTIEADGWGVDELQGWGLTIEEKVKEAEQQDGDVEFTEILGEEHNYIVLFFDNTVDWLQAQSLFEIEPRREFPHGKDGKTKSRVGIGRVINGAKALQKIIDYEDKH